MGYCALVPFHSGKCFYILSFGFAVSYVRRIKNY
jgi:hypothetical protein